MRSKFLKKIAYKILPFAISLMQRAIFITCKKVYHLPKQEITSPIIWVCWHGHLLMAPYIYRKIKPIPHKVNAIVSKHIHGDIAVLASKRFHINFIRGSSRNGAVKALKIAIDTLNAGEDIGITPDGPIGPLHSVSDGVVALSSKCNVKIIAIGWSADSFWRLKSWDEAKIPKPFSTITFKASESFALSGLTKDEAKNRVYQNLMECVE